MVDLFNNVDGNLAKQIAIGIGVFPPATPGGTGITASSPAVNQENTMKTARTRKVAILAENGFDYPQVAQVMEDLKKAGVQAEIISKNLGIITSTDGRPLEVGKNFLTAASVKYDAVYVPGGRQSVDSLIMQGDAIHFVNEAFKHAKAVGAMDEGIDFLRSSQIKGVNTAGPETKNQLITEHGVVTIRNASDTGIFSQEFIHAIAQHRHWGRQNHKQHVPA